MISFLVIFSTAFLSSGVIFGTVHGQTNGTLGGISAQTQLPGFSSVFDTYVTSTDGYGIFEEKDSNNFQPGETILLYIEPTGIVYGTPEEDDNQDDSQLYTINLSADFLISDSDGKIIGGQQGLPVLNTVSHHQNKEISIPFTISQSSPLPEGDYVITYTIHDDNSGKSFGITKDITISNDK